MKIVILDAYTSNPGDLSWEKLEALGDLEIYDRTPHDKIVERSRGAQVILSNKTPISASTLDSLEELQYIGVLATGYNVIDVKAARERNVTVTNAAGYGTDSVAQMTIALILELCHRVQRHSDSVKKERQWSKVEDFCFWNSPQVELAGKTLGIIGFGTIGEKVADIAEALGMHILGSKRTRTDQSSRPRFRWSEIPELLEESDVVSIHCPLLPSTEGLINSKSLATMKSSAFLVNTARGPIVVEKDLADALNEGVIAGAALDVLSKEPPPDNNPLYTAKNCIITPHIAWATQESRSRLIDIVAGNLAAWKEGNPVNVVN